MSDTLDLADLTPAPWVAGLDLPDVAHNNPDPELLWSGSMCLGSMHTAQLSRSHCEANAAFIALARNALDIMLRRGWYAVRDAVSGLWVAVDAHLASVCRDGKTWPDPFTALVEAERWLTAQEAKP